MGVEVIVWIQQVSSPFFDAIFQSITMLGEEFFYIAALTLVYWCIDKQYGAQLSYVFFLSAVSNQVLKVTFATDRPIGTDGIRTLREHTAGGYAFPSGHTQNTATFWYFLMITLRRRWLTILGTVIIILMALSRLYLGVHWPADVIGGIIFAVIFVHIGRMLYTYGFTKKHYLLPIVLGAATLPFVFFVPDKNYAVTASILAGASLGFFIEQERISYTIPGELAWKIVYYVTGLAVLLIIKEGFKLFLAPSPLTDMIRYLLIGFWAAAGAPWMFSRIELKRTHTVKT